MDTALPQKFPFILDRNLAKANCTENQLCTSCDIVVRLLPHKNLIAFTDLVGAHRPHASPRQWPLLLPCLQDQWAEGRAHHHGALHELCHERHPAHRPAPRPLDPQGRGPPLFSRRLIKGLMLIDAAALIGIF